MITDHKFSDRNIIEVDFHDDIDSVTLDTVDREKHAYTRTFLNRADIIALAKHAKVTAGEIGSIRVDYLKRLIAGVREGIKNAPENIEACEITGEEGSLSSPWINVALLCDVVEKEILQSESAKVTVEELKDKPIHLICSNCDEWEQEYIGSEMGYCPVFIKNTSKDHGTQCTAHSKLRENKP